MAQSSKRPDAAGSDTDLDETGDTSTRPAADDAAQEAEAATPADRTLWTDARIDPVEIALPAGTGLTLRAYRPASEVTPTDISDREQDDPFAARARPAVEDDDEVIILDEEFADELDDEDQESERRRAGRPGKAPADPDAAGSDEPDAEADDDEDGDAEADAEAADDEEVPVFLSHRGKLLLFRTPEALVAFVRSGAPNDLDQLDTWGELAERVEPADVVALPEDTYELDLVVENLRGGHDVWDASLLISAGEVARDLSYALRMPAILDMLSTGSSLDDLDEALRATANGGIGGFFGRRRLKKIGAQTASLGWRTIIGKISAAVDWRD